MIVVLASSLVMNTAWVASKKEEGHYLWQGCRVFLWENNLDNGTGAATEIQMHHHNIINMPEFGNAPISNLAWQRRNELQVEGTIVAIQIDADGLATS